MKKFIFLGLTLVALTASSDENLSGKKYQIPAGTSQTTTVLFPKGNLHLSMYGDADAQYYGIMDGPSCRNSKKLIKYNAGIGGNTTEKIITVEAGKTMVFIATILKHSSSGVGNGYGISFRDQWNSCTRVFSFAPKPGAFYIISQEALLSSTNFCSVSVKEKTTDERPHDLVEGPRLTCMF